MGSHEKSFIPALGYDFLTAYYDLIIRLTMPEKKIRDYLIELVKPDPQEEVLEFGFGTGQNLLWIKKRFPESQLTGLDIDPKVREIAKYKLEKKKLNIPLDLYDGEIFPYANESFDKVCSCLVFHQLSKVLKTNSLREIYRVLKPGGIIIIADWGKAKNRMMRYVFKLVQILDGFESTQDNVVGMMPEYIKDIGFTDVRTPRSINTMLGTFSYYTASKK